VANDMTGRFVGEKGIQRALTKAENEKFEKRIAGLAKKVIFYDALAGLEKSKLSPEEKNKRISQLYKEYRMNTSKLEGASEKGKRVEGYNPKSKFSQVNIQKQIVKLTTRGLYRYQPMPEPESEKTTNVLTTGPTRGERAVSYVANSRINRWAKRRAEGQGEKYNAGTGVVGVGRRFWMKTDSEARAENALKEARKGEAQRKKEKEKSKKNKKP
jgi:hypothetical protein